MIGLLKKITRYFERRRNRFYFKSKLNLIIDISLSIIVLILIALVLFLYLKPEPVVNVETGPIAQKYQLDLNNPPLDIDIKTTGEGFLRSLKDPAHLNIHLNNKSRVKIEDISIEFVLLDRNFLISKIETGEIDNIEIDGNKIEISEFNSHQEKDFSLSAYFKSRAGNSSNVKWQALLMYFVDGQKVQESIFLEDIILAAQLETSAVAYYHSSQGDQLGSGPLPPLVSLPTSYWIFFDVKSNGEFTDLVFSAKLAPGVELSGNRALLAGNFNYNESLRQVVWTIENVASQGDSYRVGFEVQFIPSENQVGQIPNLLTDIICYGRDVLINDETYYNLPNITTNLDNDRLNKGQGEVALP